LGFESLLTRHLAGEDNGARLWNLLALETWFRELLDGGTSFIEETRRRASSCPARRTRIPT
jgi:hypothetical protein